MKREYRNFIREEKNKSMKLVLVDKKSQMEVERLALGKKNSTGALNRWIREYIQEGEENCFKKNNNIKIKNKLKTTQIKYRCSHS